VAAQPEQNIIAKDTAPQAIEALATLLRQRHFDCLDEKRCQSQIQAFLAEKQLPFEREYRLSSGPIDFYFPRSGLGLEVKANKRWSKREVYRQVERYCSDPAISAVLLATARAQSLPSTIHGKPVAVYLLGSSAL
jgi:hypothetical protein